MIICSDKKKKNKIIYDYYGKISLKQIAEKANCKLSHVKYVIYSKSLKVHPTTEIRGIT